MFEPRAGTVAPSAFRTFPVDAAHAAAGEINARGNIAPPVPSQFMRSSPPRSCSQPGISRTAPRSSPNAALSRFWGAVRL
jgi:hypothetical protein